MFMEVFSSVTIHEDFTTVFFTMKYITFNPQLSTPLSLGLIVLWMNILHGTDSLLTRIAGSGIEVTW